MSQTHSCWINEAGCDCEAQETRHVYCTSIYLLLLHTHASLCMCEVMKYACNTLEYITHHCIEQWKYEEASGHFLNTQLFLLNFPSQNAKRPEVVMIMSMTKVKGRLLVSWLQFEIWTPSLATNQRKSVHFACLSSRLTLDWLARPATFFDFCLDHWCRNPRFKRQIIDSSFPIYE
jgi:hypothetical protein